MISKLAELVPYSHSVRDILVILIGCMIFLLPSLDVIRVFMPTFSLPAKSFRLTYDLNTVALSL